MYPLALSHQYRAIGFITFEGKYTALSENLAQFGTFDLEVPPPDAMESMTASLGMQNVLLDFFNKNKLPEFLRRKVLSRQGIGAFEVPVEKQFNPPEDNSDYMADNFDGLIYIKTTTASQNWNLNQS